MAEIIKLKHDATKQRWLIASKDHAFNSIRDRASPAATVRPALSLSAQSSCCGSSHRVQATLPEPGDTRCDPALVPLLLGRKSEAVRAGRGVQTEMLIKDYSRADRNPARYHPPQHFHQHRARRESVRTRGDLTYSNRQVPSFGSPRRLNASCSASMNNYSGALSVAEPLWRLDSASDGRLIKHSPCTTLSTPRTLI